MTGAVGSVFLGLTVGCARCHDHKFDPISQADYYRLQAFFAAAQPKDIDLSTPQERADHGQRVKALKDLQAPFQKEVADLDGPYRTRLTEAKKAKLADKYREALAVDPKKRTPEQKELAAHAQTLIKVTWDEILDAMTPAERAKRANWRELIHAIDA